MQFILLNMVFIIDISSAKGSQVNDILIDDAGVTKTNFSGGIVGGISNGNDIYFTLSLNQCQQ